MEKTQRRRDRLVEVERFDFQKFTIAVGAVPSLVKALNFPKLRDDLFLPILSKVLFWLGQTDFPFNRLYLVGQTQTSTLK